MICDLNAKNENNILHEIKYFECQSFTYFKILPLYKQGVKPGFPELQNIEENYLYIYT